MSITLYISNLPKEVINSQELLSIFSEVGDFVTTKVIINHGSKKCRGFGLITVLTEQQANEIIEKFNNYVFQGNVLAIEKANPHSKNQEMINNEIENFSVFGEIMGINS